MKRIISILVCSLFVGYFAFAVTVDEWRKMPSERRLSSGALPETTLAKRNSAIELLKNKNLTTYERRILLVFVIDNSGGNFRLTEEEFNEFKPYADELDSLIGKNGRTANFLLRTRGQEQQAIAYYQDLIKANKNNAANYYSLFNLANRINDKTLRDNSATEFIKLVNEQQLISQSSHIKDCLPYAYDKISVDDYIKLLSADNEELTNAVIDVLRKRSDAKLCRDIVSKMPTNSRIIASLKPLCDLHKLTTKEQVQFYLLLWKANLAFVTENPDAKNIVDGAVTCIAQLLQLGENPSISQVEKILSEMK